MSGFTKLYSTILDSSVWSYDAETRIVWLTMLAMASKEGIVHASVGGIQRRANVPLEAVNRALTILESPDEDDKSGVNEGRRVIRMQGSWQIVNSEFYREARSLDAVRKAQWRAKQKRKCPGQSRKTPPDAETDPDPNNDPSDRRRVRSPKLDPCVREVFDHWTRVMGKTSATKLTKERRRKIEQRLRSYSLDDLKRAVTNAATDDWVMGRDPKSPKAYNDLITILRDDTQVERFRDMDQGGPLSDEDLAAKMRAG